MTLARSPRALPLLIGSSVVIAAVCLAVAATAALQSTPPSVMAVAECLALLFLGVRFHLPLRLGAERVELSWSELGFLLGFALVPQPWLVLLTPLAVTASWVQRRRAPIKTVYTVASYSIAAAGAASVLALAHVGRPFVGTELLWLLAAGAVAGVITYLTVAAVIAVVQDVPLLATWRAAAGLQLLTLGGNLCVAVGVLVLLDRYGPWAATIVPVAVLTVHLANELRLRAGQERDAGQRHAAAVGRLTEDLDEPGVLQRATVDACALADVDVVEVEIPGHGRSSAVLYRYSRLGCETWMGNPAAAPPLPARVVIDLSVPTDDGAPDGTLRAWLMGGGPELRLGQFQESALRSLAEHAGAAVRNARIHARQTYYATHDQLTGLPARSLLIEHMRVPFRASVESSEKWEPVAFLIISLTGYGDITRTLGHDIAEDLLVRTARRLQDAAVGDEYVTRVDAANFGVFLPSAIDPTHVRSRALHLLAEVAVPFQLDTTDLAEDLRSTQVTLDAAAGAAYFPTPVGSGTELLRQASVALEQARAANISLDFYNPGADMLGGPAAIVLTSELRAGLKDNQFDLHYQPIVHLPSGAPVGMEGLVRWHHPTKGLLYGGQFMTVLEHSPDHARFVAWQLDRALHTRQSWGERDLPISINLAARCLLDRRFPDQVADALHRAGIPGDQLMFEFAESAVLTQLGLVGDVLVQLRKLGIQIAIDNLGTGTSALFGLLNMPATHVKVDGHFVRQMLVDPEAAAVVGMGLDLGRRADLQFVATGVNSAELTTALRQRGCDIAQGPYLVRPMLADQLPAYLASAPEAPVVSVDAVVSLDSRRRTPTL
jgi:diguanylate cyclase